MQNFIYENPTKIIFGKGQIKRIGQETARFGKKVLLVYGQGSIKKNDVYDQVMTSLAESNLAVVEFPGVRSNPVLSHAVEGIKAAKREGVEVILAVGGGSVIDTAKTIAAGVMADHDVWDLFTYKKAIQAALPVLTVVTISASASEMNAAAVITREEGRQKFSIRSPHIQPKVSILDPTVLFTLDMAYSAYSAVDAVTHMLEGYFNNAEPNPSPLQDGLVEGLMKTIMGATETILQHPEDYDARANMMWAATLAFNGLTTAGMGQVALPAHMIEHSLSALYDVAHGAGLSIILPGWMKSQLPGKAGRFAKLAREVFGVTAVNDEEAALAGIERLKKWFSLIGSPVSLREAEIPGQDIERIAENAFALAQVWGLKAYSKEAITEILELCK
ncbi:MAG TPA: NADH-dependent alcohol dehydrogenase [Syntrophus sp. (in: bacteria)]|nr:NADH-dependent alcohol dehydrogenase [Syntrophus sp. (in: bacteria)]